MGIHVYSLSGGNVDVLKMLYMLGMGMGMRLNFFYGYRIMKFVSAPPRCHPNPMKRHKMLFATRHTASSRLT